MIVLATTFIAESFFRLVYPLGKTTMYGVSSTVVSSFRLMTCTTSASSLRSSSAAGVEFHFSSALATCQNLRHKCRLPWFRIGFACKSARSQVYIRPLPSRACKKPLLLFICRLAGCWNRRSASFSSWAGNVVVFVFR
uniref:(northern house mosquito) hypothetical protein n=1 Tax=Culex pipiens TaxID=7175 RepID=A0A8D8KDG8_CULPI